MSKLYFRIGETEGFTSKKLADKKNGYANPIRELLQNSLDASKEAEREKCAINIYINSIDKNTIPHIRDYEESLNTIIKFQKKSGSYNHNSEQIVNTIQEGLNNNKLNFLMFADNGKGMSPDILNGLIGERSVKQGDGSGGSFGVGHLSPYFLSSLRYVLYSSKYRDKNNEKIKTLFSGVPILAGFEDENATRGATGRILEHTPTNENKPEFVFPTLYPEFIKDKMNNIIDTGSMVTILGLNKDWDKDADYAIVSNFFYAINKKELTINIKNNDNSVSIDERDIDKLLKESKDNKRAMDGSILCGSDTYQVWLAVKNNEYKKIINLENNDKVCVYVKNNIEANSVIALIRNGMLIARHDKMLSNEINNLRKNEDFEPFSVVININDKECPKLFRLVKGAENPYHNKLEKNRLIKKDEKRLKEIFKEVNEKIKPHLVEKSRDSFDLSMPLLEIPNKAEAQGNSNTHPRNQTQKATVKKQTAKQPIGDINKTDNGVKRPFKGIVSRVLESKNAARFKDNGETIEMSMSVNPRAMDTKDEVYFSVSLAMDTDNDVIDSALELKNVFLNNNEIYIPNFIDIIKDEEVIKIPADKSQANLGKLHKDQVHTIKAIIKKPKNLKNIGVALKPFLGLKQKKGV
jgi:hypothetical protein